MKEKIVIYGLTALTTIIGIIMIIYYSQEYMRSEFSGLGILFWAAGWFIYLLIFIIVAFIVKAASGNAAGIKAWLLSLIAFVLSFIFSIIASNIHMKNYDKKKEAEYQATTKENKKLRETFKTDSLNPVLLYKMAKLEGCYTGDCDKAIKYLKKAVEIDTNYFEAYKELYYNLKVDNRSEEAYKLMEKMKKRKDVPDKYRGYFK